jgi:hypothetical protein
VQAHPDAQERPQIADPHGGMKMRPQATGPQIAAVAVLSLLSLAGGVLIAVLIVHPDARDRVIDVALLSWFVLTGLAVTYVAWDVFTNTPQPVIMTWGWLLLTLYTGPVGAVLYVLSCQEPARREYERFVEPLWKQGLGSTVHCVAGDATGIIASAVVTAMLRLPMGIDLAVEYVAGFAFGWLVFQALFMRRMLGGSYAEAVRRTFLPEWLSMNAVMAGMVPVMMILASRDMAAMDPRSPRFWGTMSLAVLVGTAMAYPINVWVVQSQLKHGMSTVRDASPAGPEQEPATERGAVVAKS